MSPVPAPTDRGTDGRMTDPRRRALGVLREYPGPVRISNVTDLKRGFVYWQTATWLVDAGLAEHPAREGWRGSEYLHLTERGQRVAEMVGRSQRAR